MYSIYRLTVGIMLSSIVQFDILFMCWEEEICFIHENLNSHTTDPINLILKASLEWPKHRQQQMKTMKFYSILSKFRSSMVRKDKK